MQKTIKLISSFILALVFLSACHQLDAIDYSPKINPETFLQNQHWMLIEFGNFSFIWSQPSSTLIVYFVGLFTMFTGYKFIITSTQKSTIWWGVGLLLTGLGALFAGTSYQALGYEIKCNGREYCTWTSWWEIVYMFLSVPGMNAFLVATAYTNLSGKYRKAIMIYAIINTIVYSIILLYGSFTAVKFLVSFEFMSLISAPSVIFLLLLHAYHYYKNKDKMNLTLLYSWLIFIAVGIAYSIYLRYNFASSLWAKGIWFTENDVLHIGMIGWVFFIYKRLRYVLIN